MAAETGQNQLGAHFGEIGHFTPWALRVPSVAHTRPWFAPTMLWEGINPPDVFNLV